MWEIYDCILLFDLSTLSLISVGSRETLSHGRMHTLLSAVGPNGCCQLAFNEWKQQERKYSKTETDVKSCRLCYPSYWLSPVQVMKGHCCRVPHDPIVFDVLRDEYFVVKLRLKVFHLLSIFFSLVSKPRYRLLPHSSASNLINAESVCPQ